MIGLRVPGKDRTRRLLDWLKAAATSLFANCCALFAVAPALAITQDNPGPAAIQFTANSGLNVKSISPGRDCSRNVDDSVGPHCRMGLRSSQRRALRATV